MKKLAVLFFVLGTFGAHGAPAPKIQSFSFEYQALKYSGEVMLPEQPAKGVVVIIPGHGSTELVGGPQFLDTRQYLVGQQYSVAYWDKAGCGLSEGEYDHNQSIESSSDEAMAAIAAIRELDLSNADNLGFWSISRGGWIVPKITESFDGTRFWISVSGTTELDNARYMLEANLKAEGRTRAQTAVLMSEWDDYQRILVRGGTLDEFNALTRNLMADPYYNSNDFTMTEEVLGNIQGFFGSGALEFDDETNLAVMYPELEKTLTRMAFPVLAVLGKRDTQVDWRATGELYAKAAEAGDMQLTAAYLETCNHVMQESVTGGVNEGLPDDAPKCAGYLDSMGRWLDSLGVAAILRK